MIRHHTYTGVVATNDARDAVPRMSLCVYPSILLCGRTVDRLTSKADWEKERWAECHAVLTACADAAKVRGGHVIVAHPNKETGNGVLFIPCRIWTF